MFVLSHVIAASHAAMILFSSTDKTLISWFCFDEQPSKPCSVVSLQAVDEYDALAFGQDAPGKWSTASSDNIRTQTQEQLAQNPAQEIVPGEFMMMAAVYQDKMVTIYRDRGSICQLHHRKDV